MKKVIKKFMEYFWEWAFFLCTLSLILAGLCKINEFFKDFFDSYAIFWGVSALFVFIHIISFLKKIDKYKQRYRERALRLLKNDAFDKFSISEYMDISNSIHHLNDDLW